MKLNHTQNIETVKNANKSLNAVVSYIDDVNTQDGVLHAWPIALKDNFNMVGTKTTASCRLLSNYESVYNATAVTKLIEAGADLVCKTSMDELGMGGTNLSALTGPVSNPFDSTRISGGSSGGSAALVGAKAVRAALGTDTGDSVRKPASFCGCVGMKPTYGRISRYGVIPYASSLDHVGYFTQNVTDAATLLEVLAGRDDKDMTSSNSDVPLYSQASAVSLEGKRIGVFKSVLDAMRNDVARAEFANFILSLEAQGAIIVEKEMSQALLSAMLPVYSVISNAEAVANHANLDGVRYGVSCDGDSLEGIMKATRTYGFSGLIKRRFIFGAYALDDENQRDVFDKAKKVRRLIVEAYAALMADVDIMLTLASGTTAPRIDESQNEVLDDAYLIGENHMVINNFTGYPSMTIPFITIEGLPLGMNLSAKPFEEMTLFNYGLTFEAIVHERGLSK